MQHKDLTSLKKKKNERANRGIIDNQEFYLKMAKTATTNGENSNFRGQGRILSR
jgi:hypothetical protein